MGNLCSVEGAIDHWIYVKTGDRREEIPALLKVILYDVKGQKSPEIPLRCVQPVGEMNTFQCPPLGPVGPIHVLELWREDGEEADWFCEALMVNDAKCEACYYFPVHRWLRPGYHYMVRLNDISLPQDDPYPDQRDHERQLKRSTYHYSQQAPDLPVQAYELPNDEDFTFDHRWDVMKLKAELLQRSSLTRITSTPWEGLEDLTNIYGLSSNLPSPQSVPVWSNDAWFGAQRLIGCNPTQIRLCTSLPENMGVTAEMLRPFLEGWTVRQIIESKRLFLVDHKILEDLPTRNDRPFCAPIALFFLNGDKQLIPIAIQLHQDIAPDNPVFLCNDAPFTWILAKMWFNLADSSVHRALTHLGFSNMLMEGVGLSLHRCLSINHPVFRILAPHLQFLFSVNWKGLNYLVAPGGWIDKTTTIGREGLFELIRRGIEDWRMDVHGNLPKELESRGVLEPNILPNYSYRDDALLLHKAIEKYVGKLLRLYYSGPLSLKEDKEIHAWAHELALPKEQGGAGLQGVPGNGRISSLEDLTLILTSVIFLCTVQHSAVTYSQYEQYGFPPNYPAKLQGEPPIDKVPRMEEEIVQALPDKLTTLDTMLITRLLSQPPENPLGQSRFQYLYEEPALKIEKEFGAELEQISQEIKRRNSKRHPMYKYSYLLPENLANSICI